jgi:hypothetical protein
MRGSGVWLQLKRIRRAARRMRQGMRYGGEALSHSPVFFANSFPKSGTHLLTQVLEGLREIGPAVPSGLPAIVTFDGETGRQRSPAEILGDLRRFSPGDVGYGHVHAFPEAVDLLCQDGYCAYFILRDPRDVALSHAHYVAEMAPDHIHYRYYHEALRSFEERLSASIAGVPAEKLASAAHGRQVYEPLPDIRARFQPYLGWMEHPQVLILRFEDFISDQGPALERVLEHAIQRGFKIARPPDQAFRILANHIDPRRSPTFRSGKIGGWKSSFSSQHKELFNDIAGDLLIRLGYEEKIAEPDSYQKD